MRQPQYAWRSAWPECLCPLPADPEKSPRASAHRHRRTTAITATTPQLALSHKSFVVAHHQLRFDLLHRIHGHAHHDQQRRAAEIKLTCSGHRARSATCGCRTTCPTTPANAAGECQRSSIPAASKPSRDRRRRPDVSRDKMRLMCSDVLRPGRMPGMNPPYFRMLSASSVGLKMMPT